ncbi:MAG TPA: isochorismatase family protein, partial [Pseudonocardiaceae bacterium]|nr:isochorismatase family protein [Pseudonocardiaceae bacterium]
EPITRLVAHFGDRTVFTRFVAPDRPTGAWADYYDRWPFALRPADSPLYQVVDAFRPDRTIDATTFGKWCPDLADLVGDDTLVLAGVSTDCCVLSTALAAADAGVRVRVAADACAGLTDETHRQALAIMRLYAPHVHVFDTAELLAS